MAGDLTVSSSRLRSAHWLPCAVASGESPRPLPAPASRYFRPSSASASAPAAVSFRGRRLDGDLVRFPEGYDAYVVNEARLSVDEVARRNFYVDGKFQQMTAWNWNKIPSDEDAARRMLAWVDIAETLHAAVDVEI